MCRQRETTGKMPVLPGGTGPVPLVAQGRCHWWHRAGTTGGTGPVLLVAQDRCYWWHRLLACVLLNENNG